MAKMLVPKSTVRNFYELIKGGWEPDFGKIKNKYFPQSNGFDIMRNTQLSRLLIMRVRRKLKKENLYFYSVNDHFKLLESAAERLDVTKSLWRLTKGFTISTGKLLDDTCRTYPSLERNLLTEVKAAFGLIQQLAVGVTAHLDDALSKTVKVEQKQLKG